MKHNRCFCMCLLRPLRLFLINYFVHTWKTKKTVHELWACSPPPQLVCNHCRKTRQRQLTYTAYWGVTQRSSGASGLNCRWSLLGDTILASPLRARGIRYPDRTSLSRRKGCGWWYRDVGNDSNLLMVFYVQIMPDDFVMQLHRFWERQWLCWINQISGKSPP